MYMYYFLGFRLWAQEFDTRRKQIRADNTFLLALDGDVDFQPKAVQVQLQQKHTTKNENATEISYNFSERYYESHEQTKLLWWPMVGCSVDPSEFVLRTKPGSLVVSSCSLT